MPPKGLFQVEMCGLYVVGEEDAGVLLKLVGALGGVVFHRGMARTACVHLGMAMQVVVQTAGDILALGNDLDAPGHEFLYRG